MLLPCSFFRLKELFQVKKGVTTSFLFCFFFFENAKNLGRSDDGKREKKRMDSTAKKPQAMILGKHSHELALHIGDSVIEISGFLNILGVRIDDKLPFKDHLSTVLRKVYAKVGALRPIRKLVPADISLVLYKAYILPL